MCSSFWRQFGAMAEKHCYSKRCQENIQPAETGSKRKRLSLSLKKPNSTPCKRFALVSVEEVEAAQKPIVPQNTQTSQWAFRLSNPGYLKGTNAMLLTNAQRTFCCCCVSGCASLPVKHRRWWMVVNTHLRVLFRTLQGYNAISVRRNPQLFDLLTQKTRCLTLCISCLTVCTVICTLKGLEHQENSQNHIQV